MRAATVLMFHKKKACACNSGWLLVHDLSAYGRVPKGEGDGGLARLQNFGAAVVVLRLLRARYRRKDEIGSFPAVFSARPAEQYFGAAATQVLRKLQEQ